MKDSPAQEASRAFVETFIETYLLVRNNFYRQTQVPIPVNQFVVLMALINDPSASISEISRTLNISKQQMTTIIDKLVKSGLAQRHPDINDRRRTVITITDAGMAILDQQKETVHLMFHERISRLSPEEIGQLAQATYTYNRLVRKMFL
ncbi:MarR family winged helix-turn-helix transcriptional regulator [Selenomonas montiformis]|uniref:MarR family transcriptional regulator n=1 Tax=Selenomonas montiformis TaxID=2652285 RepID=A0A6I2UPF1_9FIRM|nr:MarR family transcriptional regulator [Selenomonas montiformis]MDY4696959.1 MarR family transcriptional regulator [Selenomonas montiformis]MSV24088.1 MarR family transcriptional regulator [Selenomonas montiformis]